MLASLVCAVCCVSGAVAESPSADIAQHSEEGFAFECPTKWEVEVEADQLNDGAKTIRIRPTPIGSGEILIWREAPDKMTLQQWEKMMIGAQEIAMKTVKGSKIDGSDKSVEFKVMGKQRKGHTFAYTVELGGGAIKQTISATNLVFAAPASKDRIKITITNTTAFNKQEFRNLKEIEELLNSLREEKPKR